jgi:hypothetical protein
MKYYIIDKLELIDGVLVHTSVGYLTSQEAVDAAPEVTTHFEDWVNNNKADLENGNITLSSHFDTHGKSYVCNTTTTSVNDMGLSEITDTSILI